MSIVSFQSEDKSDFLCKRFASLATSYFDHPANAQTPSAQVPLENLFRLLEMFRNDTFSDENRRGVLALDSFDTKYAGLRLDHEWYNNIKPAIEESMTSAFGNGVDHQSAIGELQQALRWLKVDKDLLDHGDEVARAKGFFEKLSEAL